MIHRYLAGVLGLLVFVLAALAWRRRHQEPRQGVALPLGLAVLIVFQALLGMWTVTLLLTPVIVMAHLLGGLTTLALLWLLVLQRRITTPAPAALQTLRPRAMLGLILLVSQISLGGWTSANYAALACPDFPTCQTYWWPPMDFREAFTLWRGIGTSSEGGVLDNDARVTIHMMHRLGAVVVVLYLSWFAWRIVHTLGGRALMPPLVAMMVLLVTQVGLGIANIVLTLPLPVAVAHNAVAALLVLSLVAITHKLYLRKTHELGNSATEHSPSVA